MPDVRLRCGAMVVLSEEDLELLDQKGWRIWNQAGRGEVRVVRDYQAKNRKYRYHLHKEVALRMNPSLLRKAHLLKVTPVNGDYLDCRRENLETVVRPARPGSPKRPGGHFVGALKGRARKPKAPPAWSRDGCGSGHGTGDGRGGSHDYSRAEEPAEV